MRVKSRLSVKSTRTLTVMMPAIKILTLTAVCALISACSSDSGSSADSDAQNGTPDTSVDTNPGTDVVTVPDTVPNTVTNPVSGSEALVLADLPNPPLTDAPSSDDEPVPLAQVFHTITDFSLVGEPSPRVPPRAAASEFTEADFAAGLPSAVVTVPEGVDPALNSAPFFAGIDNVRVNAGDIVEIRYAPEDPEGELPGMFAQELPPGATFDDNFDGTRTLQWQTFQADVGITEFTVVAIDPAVSDYRSSQTLLIAVDEAIDPAAVPNAAPSIRPVDDYTVRVGDPVVLFLDGVDRNGTEPTFELPNPPPGATLTPDERDAGLAWFRFVPETVGTVTVDIVTRDAIDTSLTGLDQVTFFVQPREAFERSGTRLRDAAAGGSVLFGSALSPVFYLQPDGGLYESFAESEFAVMTPESSMKWDAINPAPGLFEWSDMDNLMQFAEQHDIAVRGHPLVWHRSLPTWVEQTAVEDRIVHMREFITRVMQRYADRVAYWDVVNEPLNDSNGEMRQSLWFETMGEEYIDIAFAQARELDPTATLVLNEFDIGFAGPKFDGLLQLVDRLLAREVPVDAVGFQMHVFSSFNQFDELAANMAAMAERGLDVHITELDVAIAGSDTAETQANVYSQVIEVCQAQPRCTVLQSWGFTDRYSFRTTTQPLYLDRNFATKPAYEAMQQTLSGN